MECLSKQETFFKLDNLTERRNPKVRLAGVPILLYAMIQQRPWQVSSHSKHYTSQNLVSSSHAVVPSSVNIMMSANEAKINNWFITTMTDYDKVNILRVLFRQASIPLLAVPRYYPQTNTDRSQSMGSQWQTIAVARSGYTHQHTHTPVSTISFPLRINNADQGSPHLYAIEASSFFFKEAINTIKNDTIHQWVRNLIQSYSVTVFMIMKMPPIWGTCPIVLEEKKTNTVWSSSQELVNQILNLSKISLKN